MTISLVNVDAEPAIPVSGVEYGLTFVDGSDRDVSLASLDVYSPGENLSILIQPSTDAPVEVSGESAREGSWLASGDSPATLKAPVFLEGGIVYVYATVKSIDSQPVSTGKDSTFEVMFSMGQYVPFTVEIDGMPSDITFATYFDRVDKFSYDEQARSVSAEMPFVWTEEYIEAASFIHAEFFIPKSIDLFENHDILLAVNGMDYFGTVDRSGSDETVVHYLLSSGKLLEMMQSLEPEYLDRMVFEIRAGAERQHQISGDASIEAGDAVITRSTGGTDGNYDVRVSAEPAGMLHPGNELTLSLEIRHEGSDDHIPGATYDVRLSLGGDVVLSEAGREAPEGGDSITATFDETGIATLEVANIEGTSSSAKISFVISEPHDMSGMDHGGMMMGGDGDSMDHGGMMMGGDTEQDEMAAMDDEMEAMMKEHEAMMKEHEAMMKEHEAMMSDDSDPMDIDAHMRMIKDHEAKISGHGEMVEAHEAIMQQHMQVMDRHGTGMGGDGMMMMAQMHDEMMGLHEAMVKDHKAMSDDHDMMRADHETMRQKHVMTMGGDTEQDEMAAMNDEMKAMMKEHEAMMKEHEAMMKEHEAMMSDDSDPMDIDAHMRMIGDHEAKISGHGEMVEAHEAIMQQHMQIMDRHGTGMGDDGMMMMMAQMHDEMMDMHEAMMKDHKTMSDDHDMMRADHETMRQKHVTMMDDAAEIPADGGGGCLIATAAFGSELAPQVQQLRELRDSTVLATSSGTAFMSGFNSIYYTFSPSVADVQRENPAIREATKVLLTPMLSSLSLLEHAGIDTEAEMLGYGMSVILLNLGMYVGIPAFAAVGCARLARARLRPRAENPARAVGRATISQIMDTEWLCPRPAPV